MKVNKTILMVRLINRTTAERNYWRAKVEAIRENRMFIRNERYERRKNKITRISRPQ